MWNGHGFSQHHWTHGEQGPELRRSSNSCASRQLGWEPTDWSTCFASLRAEFTSGGFAAGYSIDMSCQQSDMTCAIAMPLHVDCTHDILTKKTRVGAVPSKCNNATYIYIIFSMLDHHIDFKDERVEHQIISILYLLCQHDQTQTCTM